MGGKDSKYHSDQPRMHHNANFNSLPNTILFRDGWAGPDIASAVPKPQSPQPVAEAGLIPLRSSLRKWSSRLLFSTYATLYMVYNRWVLLDSQKLCSAHS